MVGGNEELTTGEVVAVIRQTFRPPTLHIKSGISRSKSAGKVWVSG